jgi:hypothetical protein
VLVDRSQRWLASRRGKSVDAAPPVQDPVIAQLVAASAGVSSPAWDQLTKIAKERAR